MANEDIGGVILLMLGMIAVTFGGVAYSITGGLTGILIGIIVGFLTIPVFVACQMILIGIFEYLIPAIVYGIVMGIDRFIRLFSEKTADIIGKIFFILTMVVVVGTVFTLSLFPGAIGMVVIEYVTGSATVGQYWWGGTVVYTVLTFIVASAFDK